MKKVLFFVGLALVTASFCSCQQGKSEKEIEALVAAKYQHKLDSMKLAEAEAKLAEQQSSSSSSTSNLTPSSSESSSESSSKPKAVASDVVYGTEYDFLSESYITIDDLPSLDSQTLRIYRNSIYARHGRKFKSADLRSFFSQYSWYVPRYDEVKLSKIESANVRLIKSYE